MRDTYLDFCPDCHAAVGELHKSGCDVEKCPSCGGQMMSCNCVYEMNGIDVGTMEEKHPDIYVKGATDEMWEKWDAEWAARRMPWTGEWPGDSECRELGLWCRDLRADTMEPVSIKEAVELTRRHERILWHVPCRAEDPGAHEDLNALARLPWDPKTQKHYRPEIEGPATIPFKTYESVDIEGGLKLSNKDALARLDLTVSDNPWPEKS